MLEPLKHASPRWWEGRRERGGAGGGGGSEGRDSNSKAA